MAGPERAIDLGFVDLRGNSRPKKDEEYQLISVNSETMADLPYPADHDFRTLSLDLYGLYVDEMPEFWSSYEGLVKVTIDTRNPAKLNEKQKDVSFVTKFNSDKHSYAPTFLYRGVFRNVVFKEWINLKIDLFELDTDASEYYEKVKSVIDGVPEMKSLDVLSGIPYLGIATKLFDSIITTFGKNPDDHLWGEFPILEGDPVIGGAFLRNGLYVLFEKTNSDDQKIEPDSLKYTNGKLIASSGVQMPTHLIFGLKIKGFSQSI